MRMRTALSLLVSLLFLQSTVTVYAGDLCDGCETYHGTKARGKIPFSGPRVCLDYVQAQRDKVVVRFVKDGRDIHTVSNETGLRDRFCFGKWRFVREDIKPDEIWFCNGSKSARLGEGDIVTLTKRNGTAPGEYVCLLGSAACEGQAIVGKR